MTTADNVRISSTGNAVAAVHEVQAKEWSEIAYKKLYLKECCSPKWLQCLIKKWISGEITARIFTDQWPDCTCVVVFYQEWLPQAKKNNLVMIATSAGEDNVGKITNIIGRTVDWSKTNLFVHGVALDMAKMISDTVYHPLGREHGCINEGCLAKRYSLGSIEQRIPISQQQIPEELYYQQLEPCHAEYIAQYWGFCADIPSVRTARFLHCINFGDSMGIFTKTTPTKLVSWAVKDASGSFIHHLYTLEEYRGWGLASAVVREMCKKIQNKGEVPFTYIVVGNESSVRLFEKIGFKEDPGLYRFFLNYLK